MIYVACICVVGFLRVDATSSTSSRSAAGIHRSSKLTVDGGAHLLRREGTNRKVSKVDEQGWEDIIWCFYEYPNGPTPFVKLNMATWKKYAPEMRVVRVNDSNVKEYIPD